MPLPSAVLRLRLINTSAIELWPATLLRARGNHDARALAAAQTVLRRKRDGRYLAAALPAGLLALVPRLAREQGLDEAVDALDAMDDARTRRQPAAVPGALPLHGLEERLDVLGLDPEAYAARTGLALVAEPEWLACAGFDRWRRPLWLRPDAAQAWQRLRAAAACDGVVLEAISGYRSHDYQLGIFARKRARGLALDEILAVNAAPGFSEHHDGSALDIGTPGDPPAEASFETTPAHAWLVAHAAAHGFRMSYPRDNPHGIVHEPWHWRYHAD